MADFDVSKSWVILIPSGISPAKTAAEELSRILGLLRQQAELDLPPQGFLMIPSRSRKPPIPKSRKFY
jgi:hypothetical protein